jgi:hypothetical protein
MRDYCAHGVEMTEPCAICNVSNSSVAAAYMKAAEAVARARVRQATAFRLHRMTVKTDSQAEAAALIETGSELDVLLAKLELARRALAQTR